MTNLLVRSAIGSRPLISFLYDGIYNKFWIRTQLLLAGTFDPHWFQCGTGSSFFFYLVADSDPGSQRIHSDPDSSILIFKQNIIYIGKRSQNITKQVRTKAFLKDWRSGLFVIVVNFFAPGSGSAFHMLILADPDLQKSFYPLIVALVLNRRSNRFATYSLYRPNSGKVPQLWGTTTSPSCATVPCRHNYQRKLKSETAAITWCLPPIQVMTNPTGSGNGSGYSDGRKKVPGYHRT